MPIIFYVNVMFYLTDENKEKFAHVIIDVQAQFCSAVEGQAEAEKVAQHIAIVKRSIDKLKIATYVVYLGNNTQNHLTARGGLYAITLNEEDIVVQKQKDSMIKGSDILSLFRKNNHTSLLISGFNRGYCVASSAIDAVHEGLNVWAMEDCIGHTKWQKDSEHNLNAYDRMRSEGVKTINSADVLRFA